ncbi:MAG: YbjQ family protein [Methanimicrococcus sp.]|nr:YbjQ family protein [Methanimicrococcus sp.]
MLTTTQDNMPNYEIDTVVGIVKGNTVRTRNIGRDIMAGMRSLVGGEIYEWTKMLAEAREQAYDRMVEDAKALGADGIVCFRIQTSTIASNSSEILCYGTAVTFKK